MISETPLPAEAIIKLTPADKRLYTRAQHEAGYPLASWLELHTESVRDTRNGDTPHTLEGGFLVLDRTSGNSTIYYGPTKGRPYPKRVIIPLESTELTFSYQGDKPAVLDLLTQQQ